MVTLESADDKYRWLNNVFCVCEGILSGGKMRARVFFCINEML